MKEQEFHRAGFWVILIDGSMLHEKKYKNEQNEELVFWALLCILFNKHEQWISKNLQILCINMNKNYFRTGLIKIIGMNYYFFFFFFTHMESTGSDGKCCRVVQAAEAAGQEWGDTPGRVKAELNSNMSLVWPLERRRFLMQPWKGVLILRQFCFTFAEVKRWREETLDTLIPASTKPQSHVVFGHLACPVPFSKIAIIRQDLKKAHIQYICCK